MLGPDSGIGSVRVVVGRRAVSLLSNRTFGAWNTWTRNLCCGTISRLWTKNSLVGFCSGECPLACGPVQWDPQNPAPSPQSCKDTRLHHNPGIAMIGGSRVGGSSQNVNPCACLSP